MGRHKDAATDASDPDHPAARIPDDLEYMHEAGKLGPPLPFKPLPPEGTPTAGAPVRLTIPQAQYLLDLLSVDGGENAPSGVTVGDLAEAIAAAHNLCPDCNGATGVDDCPTCGGNGFTEPEADDGHGPCGGTCAPDLKDGEACALCGHVAGTPCRGDCPPLPVPGTVDEARAWLAALQRVGLLWHMDDDPLDCVWSRKGGPDLEVTRATKRALARQQDAARAACEAARVDIFELYPEVA